MKRRRDREEEKGTEEKDREHEKKYKRIKEKVRKERLDGRNSENKAETLEKTFFET
jgi:hypothetical protein